MIGMYTLAKKESLRFVGVWTQTLLSPIISNLLFLLVFGAIMTGRPSPFEGVLYLSFLIPGLAAMGLITNAFMNPSSSLVLEKYTGIISNLLMIPLSGAELVLGYVIPSVLRGIFVAAVTIAVGAFFTPIIFANIWVIILATLLVGLLFGSLGVIVGIISTSFDQMGAVSNFIIQPLVYLGGVFFSVSTLPAPFDTISLFNPMLYIIDFFRYGFLGQGDVSLGLSFLVTFISAFVAFGIAWMLFARGYKLKT